MISIPDVTLVFTASVRVSEHIEAMEKCISGIDFGKILFLSHDTKIIEILPDYCDFQIVPEIKDIMDYNRLMFYDVGQYIHTSHALFAQDHAWITNPELWNNEWLEYDWIGAPWPIRENSYIGNNGDIVRVGNGGFSLRSKKMMDLPTFLGLELTQEQGFWNEDGNFCCYYRKEMLENGIKYAPVEVAALFSYENPVPENSGYKKTFGFHKFQPLTNQFDKVTQLG